MKDMQYHPKELLEATKTKIWGYSFPQNGNGIIVILWPTNLPKLLGNVIFIPYLNENKQ